MPEEILPHPVDKQVRYEAGDTPRDIEQRELFGDLEHLVRTAIPRTLLHLDPLRLIKHEHDVLRKMGALAADHPGSPSLGQSGFQPESIPEIAQEENSRQNRATPLEYLPLNRCAIYTQRPSPLCAKL